MEWRVSYYCWGKMRRSWHRDIYALLYQTYVDHICLGADSISDAHALQRDLMAVFNKSGIEFTKWSNNFLFFFFLRHGPSARIPNPLHFDAPEEGGIKVLGLQQQPMDDVFGYALCFNLLLVFTKYSVLLLITRIFDPLGCFF